MPRTPKYCLHKASGRAVVRLNGKDHYLGRHGSKASKDEYDRLISEWLDNGRRLPDPEETIARLCHRYRGHAETYYVKNGVQTDELGSIRVVIGWLAFYGSMGVNDFGPINLETIRDKMIAEGNARQYINKQVGRIRRIFKWGVSKGIVSPMTLLGLQSLDGLKKGRSGAKETGPVLPVSEGLVDRTMDHASPVIVAMVRIQQLTGCRPEEVRKMRPCDIDRSRDVWRYVPDSHKMEHYDRARIVMIGPRAQEILLPYLLRDPDDYCFHKPTGGMHNRSTYISGIHVACRRANPAPKGLTEKEKRAWHRANSEYWAPNQLRHSAATAIRKDHGLEAAQVVLGHANADVTQIYAEKDIEKAEKIMREVG